MRSTQTLFLLTITLFLSAGCAGKKDNAVRYTDSRFFMSTVFDIIVYSPHKPAAVQEAMDKAFTVISNLEQRYSVTLGSSALSGWNSAGSGILNADDSIILKNALSFCKASGGLFDITVEPLVSAWGFYGSDFQIPDDEKLAELETLIGWDAIKIIDNRLELNGRRIDLGGILKGMALDRAMDTLKQEGITSALINAGGNVLVSGPKPGGINWKIAVRHPRNPEGYITSLDLPADHSIATSGDYERFFITNGRRYHHILDTRTGYPAVNGTISVSVIAKSGESADAHSTILFLMGPDKGLAYAESKKLEVLYVLEMNGKLSTRKTIGWPAASVPADDPAVPAGTNVSRETF